MLSIALRISPFLESSTLTNMTMKRRISSFAVLDLETTSLPNLNFNKTNITEISIHGFKAEDVANAIKLNNPRINHKLTLLFNPLMVIHPDSEHITGLNNYVLENESTLDLNAANVIINFLKHLQQPVCLVAHNGNDFDFRVLKHAFSKLKLELPNEILCLDSLEAIRSLDLVKKQDIQVDMELVAPLPDCESDLEIVKLETPSKIDEINEKTEEETTIDSSESAATPIKSSDDPGKTDSPSPTDWQKFNETTPRRPPNVVNIERKRKRIVDESSLIPTEPISRKSLKFNSTPTKPKNYKLGTIYEHLFGNPPETAHHAEADVITLKKIMLGYGKSFVDYAEENAKPFSEVKKLGAR